jgi:hypothetical protein
MITSTQNSPGEQPRRNAEGSTQAPAEASSIYQKILERLGITPQDARTIKQDALLYLLGEVKAAGGAALSLDEQEAVDSARCRLARTLGNLNEHNPQIRTIAEKAALSFAAFAPDSSDNLHEQSLRALAKMDAALATKLVLLLCKNKNSPELPQYLRLLEELNQPLQVTVAVELMRQAAPTEKEGLHACLAPDVRNVLDGLEIGPFDAAKPLDPRIFMPAVLKALNIPKTQHTRIMLTNHGLMVDRDRTPDVVLSSIDRLPDMVSTLTQMTLMEPAKREYAVCVTAAMAGANKQVVMAASTEALSMLIKFFKDQDQDLASVIKRYFHAAAQKGEEA